MKTHPFTTGLITGLIIASAIAAIVALVYFYWPHEPKPYYRGSRVDISWCRIHSSSNTVVQVLDEKGVPVDGVLLESVSYSGGSGNTATTSPNGTAMIRAGEREVIKIRINNIEVPETDDILALENNGFFVTIVVKDPTILQSIEDKK